MAISRVKLLLVDDHEVVRFGLASLFATLPRFLVVGEAGTVAEAVAKARRQDPDVVLLDVRLPDGTGVGACREIRSACPRARVLMLTSYADDDAVVASIMAGAAGYILKRSNLDRLIEAVDTVAQGGLLMDPAVSETVLKWMQRAGREGQREHPNSPIACLTDQERKILLLIADGKTNREIAERLYIGESTVKTHVSNLLRKLDLTRRSEAAAFAARMHDVA